MPAPQFLNFSRVFRVEILSGEMDDLFTQIRNTQEEINQFQNQIRERQIQILNLKQQILDMYISSTGSLPHSE